MYIMSYTPLGVWSSHPRYWELHTNTSVSVLQPTSCWRYVIFVVTNTDQLLLGATLNKEVQKSIIDILNGVEMLSTIIITNGCSWCVRLSVHVVIKLYHLINPECCTCYLLGEYIWL